MIGHKFNAKRCESDGVKFSSKLERSYYNLLKIRQSAGEVIFFLMQVPLSCGGGVRYIVDFVEFLSNGEVEFVEVKGKDLPLGIAKRKIVEDKYPIKIKVVKKV